MKKICLLCFALVSLFSQGFGQIDFNLTPVKRCATTEVIENFRKTHPNAETDIQFENWLSQKIAERKANPTGKVTPTITVPIVFHIIHDNETVGSGRNISQAAIQQQVLQLNKDYANLSNSPYAVAQDMGIQFALAQKDPGGAVLAEPGIDRINRVTKGWTAPPYTVGYANAANDYLTSMIKPNSIWDPTRYVNVWISEYEAGILGISTFPTSSGLTGLNTSSPETNSTAGVAISYTSVGSMFASNGCTAYSQGKTLTHELGHYFGLRHIWGDANCGDDFCGDTPVHFTSNSGEPTHPKPNSCGTADEMFENYMDYTDDNVLNTFTVNQGDRMTAVIANSPRRSTLATSNAGLVLVTGSNKISFADCNGLATVTETSSMTTCPKYKDVTFLIDVEQKATATTVVTVNAGGTALPNTDYQLLTPSLTFNSGDNYKAITVRVFDNAIASGNKTVILSYTIGSGGGVTAGATAQTMTLTIIDDDYNATINQAGAVTLLSENFGTTTGVNAIPGTWTASNAGTAANVFTANNVSQATYGFTGNAAHITNGSATQIANGTAAVNYSKTTTTDARLFTPSMNATGVKNLKIDFDYVANGEAGADVGILYYSVDGTNFSAFTDASGNVLLFQGKSTLTHSTNSLPSSTWGTATLRFLFRWINDNSAGTNPPWLIDNVVVSGNYQTVESTVSSTITQPLIANTDAYLYSSADGQLIARITNPSVDLGCVTASLTQAGTGRTALNTAAGSYFRTNKVIQVSPATANATATYQGTLYFTTAELSPAWSGAEIAGLKILKVKDGVSLSSTLTPTNSQLVTPTFTDNSASGYYSYTGNFTGFSQFILVSPNIALPVELLDFNATAQSRSILLQWSTSQEINNKGFALERSTNGVDFTKIGWIDGRVNSDRRADYTYSDNFVQAGVLYYYRLVQTDLDGREKLSVVRQAKIDRSGLVISLSPVPAKDRVNLYISGANQLANLTLVNAQGQVVRTWNSVNAFNNVLPLDISGLAGGTYILNINLPDRTTTKKILISQ